LTIFGEKMACFSKNNVLINFLQKLAAASAKKYQIFAKFFGPSRRNFQRIGMVADFHIKSSLPRRNAQRSIFQNFALGTWRTASQRFGKKLS
jgi:hypothetical protein